MKYYPLNLDIKNKNCLVVGGGRVATRKVLTLVNCGANVTVVSPEVANTLKQMAEQGLIVLETRPFKPSDLNDQFLVIGATNIDQLNSKIASEAQQRSILCNIIDQPEACSFILPSILNRGDLLITISTSGQSPAFSKHLRKKLEKEFGDEYAVFLKIMGTIRSRLLKNNHNPEEHKNILNSLISSGLLNMIREQKHHEINKLLLETIGEGYEFESLMQE